MPMGGGYSPPWLRHCVDHTQIIGGDTVKLLGGYIPPRVSAPLHLNIEDCNLFSQSAFKGFFAGT